MFSVSDIKEEAYPAAFRRGKELYEKGAVSDFSYEVYRVGDFPKAEVQARVRGNAEPFYQVELTIDEEFGEVSNSKCECEAFYNYEGLCKHCVAVLFSYVNRRRAADILKLRGTDATEQITEEKEQELKTNSVLKNMLNQYSMQAGAVYLLPDEIYGKVELVPYFKMNYGFATLEFKIGAEQKYVLKNISAFLHSIQTNEKVRYGKKLDFYHHMDAFTETAKRIIRFMQIQEADKQRQSKFHAYYAYTGGYERSMELDGQGIDRFFEAMGTTPFMAEIGYLPEDEYQISEEEKRPVLHIKQGSSGIFLQLEDLQVIHGERYVYFYESNLIYRSNPGLKGRISEFFEYMNRQTGGEAYIATEELPMFCRDLLPLIRENFKVQAEGFDESLYVPPKPEFELYLDKPDANTVGAKLVAVYGDEKYNVLEKSRGKCGMSQRSCVRSSW